VRDGGTDAARNGRRRFGGEDAAKIFVAIARAPSARQNETANPSRGVAASRLARSRNTPPRRIGWH
jgi:hypothetical protein